MSSPKASSESAADDVNQRTNGRHEGGANGNDALNNNQDEYKLDMKSNGSDKIAEDDPLTGRRKREGSESAKEPKWSQRFASTNFFMLIFLLAYVLQGKVGNSNL